MTAVILMILFKGIALDLSTLHLIDKKDNFSVHVVWNINQEKKLADLKEDILYKKFFPINNNQENGFLKMNQIAKKNGIHEYQLELWDNQKKTMKWKQSSIKELTRWQYLKVILDNKKLYIAYFHPFSSGSGFICLDYGNGKLIWTADVVQMNIEHSEYYNEVFLKKIQDKIIFAGEESGGYYIQVFDALTGKRLFSEIRKNHSLIN